MHIDDHNVGVSFQVALGPHTGGQLLELHSQNQHVLWGAGRWNRTNGSAPHLGMPYAGDRIAVIAYCHDAAYRGDASAQRASARRLGFPVLEERTLASAAAAHARVPRRRLDERSDIIIYYDLCDAAS